MILYHEIVLCRLTVAFSANCMLSDSDRHRQTDGRHDRFKPPSHRVELDNLRIYYQDVHTYLQTENWTGEW